MNSFTKVAIACGVGMLIGISFPKKSEASEYPVCQLHGEIAFQVMVERQKGTPRSEVEGVVSSKIGREIIRQAYASGIVQKKRIEQVAESFAEKFEKICDANYGDGVAI